MTIWWAQEVAHFSGFCKDKHAYFTCVNTERHTANLLSAKDWLHVHVAATPARGF